MTFYLSGSLASAYLSEDTMLRINRRKILLKKNTPVFFFEDGKIKEAYLLYNTDFTVQKQKICFKASEADTHRLIFYPSGRIKQGYLCGPTAFKVGTNNVILEHTVGFDLKTKVMWGSLHQPQTLEVGDQIIVFDSGCRHSLGFHENGSIQTGTIRDIHTFTIDNLKLDFKGVAVFDNCGRIIEGTLAGAVEYNGMPYLPGKKIELYYSNIGKLSRIKYSI